MKAALLATVGTAILLVMVLDVLRTVVAAGSGAGPISGRLSALLWRRALSAGRTPSGPRHRFLAGSGVVIFVVVLLFWILVVWGAWCVVFSASSGAVRDASGRPAGQLGRISFAGSSVFSGSSSYSPGQGAWQLATVAAAASGLVFCTLSITYLVPVASAVAERRRLAAYVSSLGGTPEEVVTSAWTGEGFGFLSEHLVALTPMVHLSGQRHLTYPVLHYFHSASERTAAATSLVHLHETVTLLRSGVAPNARPDPAAIEPLSHAVQLFLDTVRSAFIDEADWPLGRPDLATLRQAGIPTVSDEDFEAALDTSPDRRRLLAGLLEDDGWTAEAWKRRRGEPQP